VQLTDLDLRELDARSVAAASAAVSWITPADLARPTPCAGWDLRALLAHMVGENQGFAAAVRAAGTGRPGSPSWPPADLGAEPYRDWLASAEAVGARFAEADLYERSVVVREFGTWPGRVALSLHVVDVAVHAWDVARSLGVDPELDPELAEAALAIALRWPYHRPDPVFDVRVEVAGDAPATDRLVGYLGRSPSWRPPAE
jgi:uncharacterized protein (TIGR03086 family)